MITVTGNTFDNRDILKEFGGRWNNADRNWQFHYLDDAQIAALRGLVGVFVSGGGAPAPTYDAPTNLYGDDAEFFNYFADQNPSAFFGFSSLEAFADHVAGLTIPERSEHTSRQAWSVSDDNYEFTGTRTLEEAIHLARHGWTDGIGITDLLTVDAPRGKRRFSDVAGGTVNVGKMLSGNPQHMVRHKHQPKHRNIRLFVETIMWKGIGVSIAVFRALIIAGMIDLLEREGYRCEIIAVACTDHNDRSRTKAQLAVRIKDASERLNLLDIAFALGHPAFTRRLLFAATGVCIECRRNVEDRGLISEAFTDDHRPGANEFYIPQLFGDQAMQLTDNPMSILPFIQPDGLPITIKGIS